MGADIHVMVEQNFGRPIEGWQPVEYEELFIWRDYSVFRRIVGGVREYEGQPETPICPDPRGLPDGASQIVRDWIEGSGYHSVTWFSWEEFADKFPWQADPNDMSHFALVGWAHRPQFKNSVRFIVGFDC